jgi:hypothetical protein
MRLLRPSFLLRLESACVLSTSVLLYHLHHGSWRLFLVLFFAPDISILFYFASSAAGWRAYNIAHTYVAPFVVLCCAVVAERFDIALLALIWFAHIGWDRMLAFGMKLGPDFWETHLGSIVAPRRLWEHVVAFMRRETP